MLKRLRASRNPQNTADTLPISLLLLVFSEPPSKMWVSFSTSKVALCRSLRMSGFMFVCQGRSVSTVDITEEEKGTDDHPDNPEDDPGSPETTWLMKQKEGEAKKVTWHSNPEVVQPPPPDHPCWSTMLPAAAVFRFPWEIKPGEVKEGESVRTVGR